MSGRSRPRTASIRRRVAATLALTGLAAAGCTTRAAAADTIGPPARVSFLGEVSWPAGRLVGLEPRGVPIGGLSGVTWLEDEGVYLAVSDDPGTIGPPRFYTLHIDLADGSLDEADVTIAAVTLLTETSGRAFLTSGIDAEGIVATPSGRLLISSEGHLRRGFAPFVGEFERSGEMVRTLELPDHVLPGQDGSSGPRHNLVFESLALTSDGRHLFTATENALIQDGPEADLAVASPVRILRFEMGPHGDPPRDRPSEFLYEVEPVRRPPEPEDAFRVNGLVELAALGPNLLLALERSYSSGVGNDVSLYLVSLAEATDIAGAGSLSQVPRGGIVPAAKELLVEFGDLGIELDNLEGMALGPVLDDGRRTLVIVGDDNFNLGIQRTQILAFALAAEPVDIAAIQGAGHRSPLEGDWLRGVEGVVTAVRPVDEGSAFWMQEAEGEAEPGVSLGVYVEGPPTEAEVTPGDRVEVDGRVTETGRAGELTVTTLGASSVRHVGRADLPAAVTVGEAGLRPPTEVVDDDGLTRFEPEFDGADFWESLEGMRLRVPEPLVVGPTRSWGELAVIADAGRTATSRTTVGGLRLAAGDDNPERLIVATGLLAEPVPEAAVGDRLAGSLNGVLHYDRGVYKLLPVDPLPEVVPGASHPDATTLTARRRSLTVATLNVQNLDAADPEEKFAGLAELIVRRLRSPDVLALQEVQDDSGAEDDGQVSAEATLRRLAGAVMAAGGPEYDSAQIDPVDGADGGQPGGNIRVAYLLDPRRVSWTPRGRAGAETPVEIGRGADGPIITPNPGRVAPADPAFEEDADRGYDGGRKSLALEVTFRGERIFLVNNHLKSKRGDDPVFGSRQPPLRITEDQRSRQAAALRRFVESLLAADPEAAVVVLGDLNELAFRPPLAVLAGGKLVNLTMRVPTESRYSFNYRGNSQLIDHILVSPGLTRRAGIEVEVVHGSADQPDALRHTDHDAVVARFTFLR